MKCTSPFSLQRLPRFPAHRGPLPGSRHPPSPPRSSPPPMDWSVAPSWCLGLAGAPGLRPPSPCSRHKGCARRQEAAGSRGCVPDSLLKRGKLSSSSLLLNSHGETEFSGKVPTSPFPRVSQHQLGSVIIIPLPSAFLLGKPYRLLPDLSAQALPSLGSWPSVQRPPSPGSVLLGQFLFT